jgi:phage terminase large subunit-like protein
MTGLEPHPLFTLPTREQALAMGPERFEALISERAKRMELERDDPLNNGYESPIWHLIDDMLCEGKRVCLIEHPDILPADLRKTGSPQLELIGRREILLHGANGASKTEYAGKKVVKVLRSGDAKRTWSFHETGPASIARQQPIIYKYLPLRIRRIVEATGRYKRGVVANVSYSQKNGFTEDTFVLDNASQHFFKNYAQEDKTVEGDQLDAAWLDELAPLNLVKTVRFRLVRRKGLLIVTFTPIKGWTTTVQEYRQGAKKVLEVDAELLPIKDANGKPTGHLEKVPRIEVAGPGTEGSLKANIVYLHSSDNPYFDKTELFELLRGARRQLILERAYGVATKAFANQFAKFSELVHVVEPDRIPKEGTNFHIVDPVAGRNWFMLWMRIDPNPIVRPDGTEAYRRWIYREWPSTDHTGLSAYIPGIGDPGAWTLPGNSADGQRGPAQDAFGWGLDRYKVEILRLEGHKAIAAAEAMGPEKKQAAPAMLPGDRPAVRKSPYLNAAAGPVVTSGGEAIAERLMDSRYGAAPMQDNERTTTLLEKMRDEQGMEFLPASGKDIGEGVQMINDGLDYDDQVPLGDYSPSLARINAPLLYISRECPNLIYALREWTGKDGLHGASKDPVDCLRYGFEADLAYIGEDAFAWKGGMR